MSAAREITMLRGMYVAPAVRRSGVGTRLLAAFVEHLGGTECYCIPFAHLTQFYQQAGFTLLAEGTAPAMLAERLRNYRSEGHQGAPALHVLLRYDTAHSSLAYRS